MEGGRPTDAEKGLDEGLNLEEAFVGGGGVVVGRREISESRAVRGEDAAEVFAKGGRWEAGALGEFERLAVSGEFDFLAGDLVAEG